MREQCSDCGMWLRVIDKEEHPCRNGKLPRRAKTMKSTVMSETFYHCKDDKCKFRFTWKEAHFRSYHDDKETETFACEGEGCNRCRQEEESKTPEERKCQGKYLL